MQNPLKLKEAEQKLDRVPLEILIPNLILIIESEVENPEELNHSQLKIIKQSAVIHLKNSLSQKYKPKVCEFFKDVSRTNWVLEKIVQNLIISDEILIAPHLGLIV